MLDRTGKLAVAATALLGGVAAAFAFASLIGGLHPGAGASELSLATQTSTSGAATEADAGGETPDMVPIDLPILDRC